MIIDGKRVLITGGSRGIGFALAQTHSAKGTEAAISGWRDDVVATAVQTLHTRRLAVHGIVADVATQDGRAAMLN
jgi:short-subunit dehydrogenase involved in D-alanine esterification of teichoic acids